MKKTNKELTTKNQKQLFPKDLIFASAKNELLIENRHQQIVDGACKIFFEKGYHPTTIRDIAKVCGMSMGQLYHYIRSKDDVLYLAHKYMQKVWYDYLEKSQLEKTVDPLEKLTDALYHSMEFIIENKKLIQFAYSESKYLDKKHLKMVLEMDYSNVIGFWHQLLEEVDRKKSIKGDLDILASLVAFLQTFLSLRSWTLRDKSKRKVMDTLYEFIFRGLGMN